VGKWSVRANIKRRIGPSIHEYMPDIGMVEKRNSYGARRSLNQAGPAFGEEICALGIDLFSPGATWPRYPETGRVSLHPGSDASLCRAGTSLSRWHITHALLLHGFAGLEGRN
jgi:hypothetical protein